MRAIGDLACLLDDEKIWQEKAIEAGDGGSLCPRWRSEVVLVSFPPPIGGSLFMRGAGSSLSSLGCSPT